MKPRVSLVKGSDGALYGATAEGGSFWGTVFKISPRSGFGDCVASARADDVAFRHVTEARRVRVWSARIGTEIKFDVEAIGKRGFGRFIWQPDSKTGSYVTAVERGARRTRSI